MERSREKLWFPGLLQKFREISYKIPRGFKTSGTNVEARTCLGFEGVFVFVGVRVQTKSLRPEMNPAAQGSAFPTELMSPVQPSVAPGVINARIYL